MIFCYACGKEIHETAATCPACGAQQKKTSNGMKYASYNEVPWYRKNWFAILCFFIFMPALFLVLLTGSVYYKRGNEVRKYSVFAKIFLLLYSLMVTVAFVYHFGSAHPVGQVVDTTQTMESTSVGAIAEAPGNDSGETNSSKFAIPSDIKKSNIVINNVDQKVTFGEYIAFAEQKNGVKTTVEAKGKDYIVHHIFPDKINDNDQDVGMQFTPTGVDGFIALVRITDDQADVDPEDIPAKFMQILLAIAPDKKSEQATSSASGQATVANADSSSQASTVATASESTENPANSNVVTPNNLSPPSVTASKSSDESAAATSVAVPNSILPSFDCAKASTAAEHMICNNSDLAEADKELMQRYKIALSQSTDKVELKRAQNAWRTQVRDVCTDVGCVANAYAVRMSQLTQR